MSSTRHIRVRAATESDLPAINDIYNYYVLNSTCTYQVEIDTLEQRKGWLSAHGRLHPVIVAEQDGRINGWGSLSSFHPRAGYRHTVENSVYVRHDCHRRGLGSLLLRELIDQGRTLGHHTIIAGISAEQSASIELHKKFGFVEVARLSEVGHKFNQWLDVVYLQLML